MIYNTFRLVWDESVIMKRSIFLITALIVIFLSAACSAQSKAEAFATRFYAAQTKSDYNAAASYISEDCTLPFSADGINPAHYLLCVAGLHGGVSATAVLDVRSYLDADQPYFKFEIEVARGENQFIDEIQCRQDGGTFLITALEPPPPSHATILRLYDALQQQDEAKLGKVVSPYFSGAAQSGGSYFDSIGRLFGALESYEMVSAEYVYEDHPGALMHTCAQFESFEQRAGFDAVANFTVAMTREGLQVIDISHTPAAAIEITELIMQHLRKDDYDALRSLYARSFVDTAGGDFDLYIDEVLVPLEQQYGDVTGYALDDYAIIDLYLEDETSVKAIQANYTVDYEYGKTEEQITFAIDGGSIEIYIHTYHG